MRLCCRRSTDHLNAGHFIAVPVVVAVAVTVAIASFVVTVIGGVGSVRGALAGALLVGLADTLARAYLPALLRGWMQGPDADALAAGLAAMSVYALMAVILLWRPRGLFPAHA